MRPFGVLLVLAGLLTGCGGESGPGGDARGGASPGPAASPPATTTPASGDAAPATDLLERYLEVFAVADAARLQTEWVPMTAPGSLARLYSEHHTTFRQALEASGAAPPREDTVETTDEGVQICTDEVLCRTYTDAVAQDGLLTSFTTNDEPLAGHVVQPGARAAAGGVTVELLTGYETSRRALFLCVRATNGSPAPVSLDAATATYTGPDGRPSTAAQAPGPPGPLAPGAGAVVCPVFEVGQPGGRLRLEVTAATSSTPAVVELPVAAAPG